MGTAIDASDWTQWNPGLDNEGLSLGDILRTLPGAKPTDIPLLIRLFENPASPIAFKGAITLGRHDAVHVLLGRGLLAQDEAFVIGFTMGTSKDISRLQVALFERIAKYLYPPSYKFTDTHLKVYELALEYGRSCACDHIYEFPLERYGECPVHQLRGMLGIDEGELRAIYRCERSLALGTPESLRLPV